jgi:hypothetical protein
MGGPTWRRRQAPEGLYRLYVEQFSRDGDQRPPYDDRRADVPLLPRPGVIA